MKAQMSCNRRKWAMVPFLMLMFVVYSQTAATADYTPNCDAKLGTPSIDCPSLPDTPPIAIPVNDISQAVKYADWAWKSFIVLNWPAVVSASPDYKRGFPDQAKMFTEGGPATPPVWGTWKEKRELFQTGDQNGDDPGPWNAEVSYHKSYPACDPTHAKLLETKPAHHMAQLGKASYDSLDEVEQVPSEARYPDTIAHKPVKPRVWRNSRPAPGVTDLTALLYEVKFNYDYYSYVRANGLYDDDVKLARAALSGSNVKGIGGFGNQPLKAISFPTRMKSPKGYSAKKCLGINAELKDNPCPTGSIQTKAAWTLKGSGNYNNPPFHTTSGQYYRTVGQSSQICTAHGTFELLGLHIIQKTILQGHFIYATFEHVSTDTDTFVYANVYKEQTYPAADAQINALTVKRARMRDAAAVAMNEAYAKLIHDQNRNSVWKNYKLTGVQFIPVDCSPAAGQRCEDKDDFSVGLDDPTSIGQPFYLANLVIETNWGLQNFQGTPPGGKRKDGQYEPTEGFATGFGDKPTDHYVANPSATTFARGAGNTGHSRKNRGRVFNMGGCMGCHGIAQGTGTDFSFALLFGGKGAEVETLGPYEPLKPLIIREKILYSGDDFYNRTYLVSESECQAICQIDERCNYFTWSTLVDDPKASTCLQYIALPKYQIQVFGQTVDAASGYREGQPQPPGGG